MHGHVLVAASGVAPHVFAGPDRGDPVEPGGVIDQGPLALGKDGVAGGVPGDAETLSDPGHGEVLDHDRLQRPPKPATRQLRSRLGREGGVLAPHVRTLGTPVTTDRDRQRGGAPAERFVGELPDHGVAHEALAAAAATPLVGFEDPAREHGTAGFEALAGHLKSELVETAERGQIGAREPSSGARRDGSAGHAGVFQMSV